MVKKDILLRTENSKLNIYLSARVHHHPLAARMEWTPPLSPVVIGRWTITGLPTPSSAAATTT